MNITEIKPSIGAIKVTDKVFGIWANEFLDCFDSFEIKTNSPVPYFLLCRAMELAFKSVHLKTKNILQVKKYSHNILKSYRDIPIGLKFLTKDQEILLESANSFYSKKGFEYLTSEFMYETYTGSKGLPDIEKLAKLVREIIARYT
tara:strand:+ start:100609 stop:101046 length:438 start_codon:yes stop_codon:yes gene_type:complete